MTITITNSDIISKIVKLVFDSLDIKHKVINNINLCEKCDLLFIDDSYNDKNINNILHLADNIVYFVNDHQLDISNNFQSITKPFLPSTLIKFIKKNHYIHNDFSNNKEDDGVVSIHSLVDLESSLNEDEILSLKEILNKDHTNIFEKRG